MTTPESRTMGQASSSPKLFGLPCSDAVLQIVEVVTDLLFEAWVKRVAAAPEESALVHIRAVFRRRWCDGTFAATLSHGQQLEVLEIGQELVRRNEGLVGIGEMLEAVPRQVEGLRGWIHATADKVILRLASGELLRRVDQVMKMLRDLGVTPAALHRHDPWAGDRAPLEIRSGPHGAVRVYGRIDDQPGTAVDLLEVKIGEVRIWISVPSTR